MKKALLPTKPRAVAKSLIMLMVGIAAFFGNALAHASIKTTAAGTPAPVVMLSLDGFRNDYITRGYSPNLAKLANTGLTSEGLIPVFPSSTFTNHYSIVTGMYPQRHGLVGNTFYDRGRDQTYRISNRKAVEDGSWYRGTPLWVAVEKAGGVAASFYWVGSEADIQGVRPSHYRRYDGRVKNSQRVQQVLSWLQLPAAQRPNLITFYFSDVDSVGHNFGPNSAEVNSAIAKVDREIGQLLQGLATLPFQVNLIITSDHGMAEVKLDQTRYFSDWIDMAQWQQNSKVITGGAYAYFYSNNSDLLLNTQKVLKNVQGLSVYPQGRFPKEMRLGDGPRSPDFVVTVDSPGYLLVRRPKGRANIPAGAHGYLPSTHSNMQGLFVAKGPNITPGRVASFENIHVYPFVMSLLSLNTDEQIDGDPTVLAAFLR